MANVQTDEVEAEYVEPVNLTTIRDAILELIPDDPNIARDVRMHDGLADIAIRWRTLRWSTCMALQNMTPAEIAEKVREEWMLWLRKTVVNTNETPRHSHILAEMRDWLRENPDWNSRVFASNKTEIAA